MKKTQFLLFLISLVIGACSWFKSTSQVGQVLSEHFKKELFEKFDTTAYNPVFKNILDSLAPQFSNPQAIRNFYEKKGFEPQLITRFYVNGGLDTLKDFLSKSGQHGINSATFKLEKIEGLLDILAANRFKNIEEVYPVVANLELQTANALLNYTGYLKYGIVNPKKLFDQYYIEVKRPDSTSMFETLNTDNIVRLLEDVQPKSSQYYALQKALLKSNSQVHRQAILVNMERLRWQIPDMGENHVQINIPDFSLTWFDNQDTLAYMKVCVGAKREAGYDEKMEKYRLTNNLDDKPSNHETPLLQSKIRDIQVNPVWNIPGSIAQNEIYWQATRDRYYLSNNNIEVYYQGKLVNDPDTIQWNKYSRDKLPFRFKQGSGSMNALGKFKFIFDNNSSIYLHDTNYKKGFTLPNRAISHGCIRIEDPLKFAELLVDSKYDYDRLRIEVDLPPKDSNNMVMYKNHLAKKADTTKVFKLRPKWFGIEKPVPLIINYVTAWPQGGSIQYRPDIYGFDEILYKALKKYM